MKYLKSFETYKINEGKYDNTNLDEPNCVYKTIESFDIYIIRG